MEFEFIGLVIWKSGSITWDNYIKGVAHLSNFRNDFLVIGGVHFFIVSSFLDITSIGIAILMCTIFDDLVGNLGVHFHAVLAVGVNHKYTALVPWQCPIMIEAEVWMNEKAPIPHSIVLITALVTFDVEDPIFRTGQLMNGCNLLNFFQSQTFQSNGEVLAGSFGVPFFAMSPPFVTFAMSTFSWVSQRVFAGRPRLPLVFCGFSSSSSTTSSSKLTN
jgi:hypothetical protein